MSIALSLLAAVTYGLSDFVGGVVSRRVSAWSVALTAQIAGGLLMLGIGLVQDAQLDWASTWWAVAGGFGNGVGTAFLYRGLSHGRMAVVGPISAVGTALLPISVGLVLGERPSWLVWAGVAVGLPGIWLVSREPSADESSMAGGVLDGILAGIGFGVLLTCLGQLRPEAGALPLAVNQLLAGFFVVVVATLFHAPWVPRERPAAVGIVCGILGTSATLAFTVATQQGFLSIASVVTSLYPAVTVLLASAVLKEPIHRAQAFGLGLSALAVALVASG